MTFQNRWVWIGMLGALGLAASAGCGGTDGPARYPVSGSVSFDGQPVPVGEVFLEPDGSQGNTGPASLAVIENGRYETAPNQGVVGGPYLVRISGYDGVSIPDSSAGMPLFPPYETEVEFPAERTTQDFDIPAASP